MDIGYLTQLSELGETLAVHFLFQPHALLSLM